MTSTRLSSLPSYAFAEVDKIVAKLRVQGIKPIDFGVGDPLEPTPEFVRTAAKKAIDEHATTGYPSYIGSQHFREAVCAWYQRRSGITLDPETEICSTLGSKEAIFNFPEGFINPGDVVLMPTPGYPPYKSGTIFAEGVPYQYPLLSENDFYPDFNSFPAEILPKAKILWLNYPGSPTGKCATREFYQKAIEFARTHNLIIASDECYLDIYYNQKPLSILDIARENIIVFHSLSKRNNMTGYRVGFACGDASLIKTFKALKTNIDSGTPNFIQEAAIAALNDDAHIAEMRQLYTQKKEILSAALNALGLQPAPSEGTFYIWQKVPEGYDSLSFAQKLLEPDTAIIVTPGAWISEEVKNTSKNPDSSTETINPGQNYVRFALVPHLEDVKKAAERLKNLKL